MDSTVTALLQLLDVKSHGQGHFSGPWLDDGLPRIFGGQLLGQALAAASYTLPSGYSCNSLHAYFLRAGKIGQQVDYAVSALRDGQRLAVRKVSATQADALTCELTASFARELPGAEHQLPRPEVPLPAAFPPEPERMARLREFVPESRRVLFDRPAPFEYIGPDARPWLDHTPSAAPIRHWIRLRERVSDDPGLHQALLAYCSDRGLLEPAMRAVGLSIVDEHVTIASLDHAVWFHRPFRADDWLLYTFEPVSVASGRGLSRGTVHDLHGRHIATLAQEALMSPRE